MEVRRRGGDELRSEAEVGNLHPRRFQPGDPEPGRQCGACRWRSSRRRIARQGEDYGQHQSRWRLGRGGA